MNDMKFEKIWWSGLYLLLATNIINGINLIFSIVYNHYFLEFVLLVSVVYLVIGVLGMLLYIPKGQERNAGFIIVVCFIASLLFLMSLEADPIIFAIQLLIPFIGGFIIPLGVPMTIFIISGCLGIDLQNKMQRLHKKLKKVLPKMKRRGFILGILVGPATSIINSYLILVFSGYFPLFILIFIGGFFIIAGNILIRLSVTPSMTKLLKYLYKKRERLENAGPHPRIPGYRVKKVAQINELLSRISVENKIHESVYSTNSDYFNDDTPNGEESLARIARVYKLTEKGIYFARLTREKVLMEQKLKEERKSTNFKDRSEVKRKLRKTKRELKKLIKGRLFEEKDTSAAQNPSLEARIKAECKFCGEKMVDNACPGCKAKWCPSCETWNEPGRGAQAPQTGARYCVDCGTWSVPAGQVQMMEAGSQTECKFCGEFMKDRSCPMCKATRCSNCGTWNEPGLERCVKCQFMLPLY